MPSIPLLWLLLIWNICSCSHLLLTIFISKEIFRFRPYIFPSFHAFFGFLVWKTACQMSHFQLPILVIWPLQPRSPGSSSVVWRSGPSPTRCSHSTLWRQRHRGSRPQTGHSAGPCGKPWCLPGIAPLERSARGRTAVIDRSSNFKQDPKKKLEKTVTMMFFSSISSPGVPLAWSSVWTTSSSLAFSSAGTEYLPGRQKPFSWGLYERRAEAPTLLTKCNQHQCVSNQYMEGGFGL